MNIAIPDLLVSKQLQDIFGRLEKEVEEVAGRKMGMSLCIFNSESGSRINYISNCSRDDVASIWESLLKAWSDGMPDIPSHDLC